MLEVGIVRGYAHSWVVRDARMGGFVPKWDFFIPMPEGYETVLEGVVEKEDLIIENHHPERLVPARGAVGSNVDNWLLVLRKEK